MGEQLPVGRQATPTTCSTAVARIHRLRLSGLPAWLMWTLLHIYFLIGFRNRVFVMAEWIYLYVTGQRTARLLYGPGARLDTPSDR